MTRVGRDRLPFALLLLLLLAAGGGAGSVAACEDAGASDAAGPGARFGAEVTVTVTGRGRVVADDPRMTLSCPGQCFARAFPQDSATLAGDASPPGLSLFAQASSGSHFAGWTFDVLELGVRGAGPSQCSPVLRTTTAPAGGASLRVTLPFGETSGTAPAGHEAECAAFTRVPLAYALNATFEDDDTTPRPPPSPAPPVEVLFEPPSLGVVAGHELGVAGGTLYWRFDRDGFSGVAAGLVDGGGGGSTVRLAPAESVTALQVHDEVLVQHSSGLVEAIDGGSRHPIGYLTTCVGLVSAASTVYCRGLGGGTTYLYASPDHGSFSYLYSLPSGRDFGVDEQTFYFTAREDDTQAGRGRVLSTPRFTDGGSHVPVFTLLMSGQTSPHGLVVGRDHLFWIDDRGPASSVVNTRSKYIADPDIGAATRSLPDARFLTVDPITSTTFWIGVVHSASPGDSSIFVASATDQNVTVFRTGLTGLGGLTADSTYVYWTESDGRVYRAPRDDR